MSSWGISGGNDLYCTILARNIPFNSCISGKIVWYGLIETRLADLVTHNGMELSRGLHIKTCVK